GCAPMIRDRSLRRISEREGRTRVAPVTEPPRHEVAEDELALGHRAIVGRSAGLRRARTGDEVGEDWRPRSRSGLDRAAHVRPQLELRQAGLRAEPRLALADVA